MVVEKLEPRRSGRYPFSYLARLLWRLLVERHRHKPYDFVEMVEGDRS